MIIDEGRPAGSIIVEEATADTLLAEMEKLTETTATAEAPVETPAAPVEEVKPPVDLPGGPKSEPRSSANRVEKFRELLGAEYDFGKASQFALQATIVKAIGDMAVVEKKSLCPKQAVVVAAVAELMRRYKVKYQTIAELILEGTLAGGKPSLLVNHPDSGLPAEVEKIGKPPERQFATRYVRLALWTNARMTGNWKKADTYPQQSVKIMNVDYITPVDALMDGHSMNRVDLAWNWAIRRTPKQDMSDKPTFGQVDAKYAASLVEGIKLPIRVSDENTTDASGKVIAEKRSSVKVIGHPAATAGTLIGLLEASVQLGVKLTEDECNTIIELAEMLAPPPPVGDPGTETAPDAAPPVTA